MNRFQFKVNLKRFITPKTGESSAEMNLFRYVLCVPTKREQPPTPFSVRAARVVKARIDRLGVSNAAVARKSGLSQNYLNERLREEKSFTLSDVERLATYFEITPAQLMLEAESVDVSGGADDDFSYDAEGPGQSGHRLAADEGPTK
jgi:transcriptional regulator with XRE-family HTH domain